MNRVQRRKAISNRLFGLTDVTVEHRVNNGLPIIAIVQTSLTDDYAEILEFSFKNGGKLPDSLIAKITELDELEIISKAFEILAEEKQEALERQYDMWREEHLLENY